MDFFESPAAEVTSAAEEREWVRRAQGGDASAFAPLVAKHRDRLYRFALRITRNSHDAEDVCQRTFINAWKYLARFDLERPFSNWLFGIAYKDAVKIVTRRKPGGELPELACDRVTPDIAAMSDDAGLWDLARRELSRERYDMLWMHYGEEIPVAEIGRITGRSTVSVKVHLFRSRGILRERLDTAAKSAKIPSKPSFSTLP